MNNTNVSFIITIYKHTNKVIENCLLGLANSLQYCQLIIPEIIIVINDDIERNWDFINDIFPDYVDIKRRTKNTNLGYCEGNNLGIRNSDSEYIFIINPDVIIKDSLCIEWMLGYSKLYNCISGKLIGNNEWYTYAASFPTDKKYIDEELPFYYDQPTLNKPGNWKKYPYIDGSLMCFSKELWEDVGGFDRDIFPGYFGENAFCFKSYLKDYMIKDIPINNLYIHNQDHNSEYSNNIIEWTKQARELFYRKYAIPNWDKFLNYLK